MLVAPMIDETRVFSRVSDIEPCVCLLRLLSIPRGIQMSAGFDIFRYPTSLERGLLGFEHHIHEHSMWVMAQFGTLNQLRQTPGTRPGYPA